MADKLAGIPVEKRELLDETVNRLSNLAGMAAVVLGGSYASGNQSPTSDLDVGLYYYEAEPFSIEGIRCIAEEISIDNCPTTTKFYEWGAWVNGGAWIQTEQGKIDFLYRNIEQVKRTIDDAHQGITQHDYGQQPTTGFYSVIYLAETQICIPLYDPEGLIGDLKRRVEIYPSKLKQKIVVESLWSAEFTLLHARGFAAHGDVYNTVGCLVRSAANLTQALFALNEQYFMRDKMVMETIATFQVLPSGYVGQINQLLAVPGRSALELTATVNTLEQVWRSVTSLPGVQYEPKYGV